jgi:hypothetical protein
MGAGGLGYTEGGGGEIKEEPRLRPGLAKLSAEEAAGGEGEALAAAAEEDDAAEEEEEEAAEEEEKEEEEDCAAARALGLVVDFWNPI